MEKSNAKKQGEREIKSVPCNLRLPAALSLEVKEEARKLFGGNVSQLVIQALNNRRFHQRFREGKAAELVALARKLGLKHNDLLAAGLGEDVQGQEPK